MLATPNRSITWSRPPLPGKNAFESHTSSSEWAFKCISSGSERDNYLSNVFVLDTNKQPLDPVDPGKARILLTSKKAAVYRRFPFTISLKEARDKPEVAELRIKIDPGSKTTGIAIVNDATGKVVFAAELSHQGEAIKKRLDKRRGVRKSRRARRTRYRQARWRNRRNKKKGWLPPSLESRITNVLTWASRFMRVCHITAISMERVKFDTQLMENAEICGVEYQQGTLAGYEVREYLLEKLGRKCTYCGKKNRQLQIEHIVPKAKYHDDRVSNLCLACDKCNKAKGTKDIKDFLKKKPDLRQLFLPNRKQRWFLLPPKSLFRQRFSPVPKPPRKEDLPCHL